MKSRQELLEEMRDAAMELASYASYAEIIGSIGHNRSAIRTYCDLVYSINTQLMELEHKHDTTF